MSEQKMPFSQDSGFNETKLLPWHQKSRGLLIFMLILLILGIGSLVGLAFTAFLLTPFLAIPIALFVLATFVGIKIGYDNRRLPESGSAIEGKSMKPNLIPEEKFVATTPVVSSPALNSTPSSTSSTSFTAPGTQKGSEGPTPTSPFPLGLTPNNNPNHLPKPASTAAIQTEKPWYVVDGNFDTNSKAIKIFKDLDTAIQNSPENSQLFVIEANGDTPLRCIPIENDPLHFSLVSENSTNTKQVFVLSGVLQLNSNRETAFTCSRRDAKLNSYRDFVRIESIQKSLVETSLKQKDICFFNVSEETITPHSSLNGYILNLFRSCIPLIVNLETNELDTLITDLSSLSMNDLLAKYAKSTNMAAIVSAYYTVNPEVGAPSPHYYRAVFRHLIEDYRQVHQLNKQMDFGLKEEKKPLKVPLFIRYFNDENEEIIGQENAAGQEGVDLNSGAYFYETKGINQGRNQEDAIVFNSLSPAAAAAYRNLSVTQKKDLMTRACKKARERHGNSNEGSCAVFSFVFGKEIITSSLGDSVVFLVIRNPDKTIAKIQLLTDNHNVQYLSDEEVKRINDSIDKKYKLEYKRGQHIGYSLSVSRSFGDKALETMGLSHDPVVKEALGNSYNIPEGGDAFLLFGCDGFYEGWEKKAKEKWGHINYVGKFISQLTSILEQEAIKNASFYEMPSLLGQSAIVDFGSFDNVSLIVKPIEEKSSPKTTVSPTDQELPVNFFGVLDGHAGNKVSLAISENIVAIIEEELMNPNLIPEKELSTTSASAYASPLSSASSASSSSTSSTIPTTQKGGNDPTTTSESSGPRPKST